MFLAVPITMMLKVIMENSYEFRWIAVAISKEKREQSEDEQELKEAVEAAEGGAMPEGIAPEGGSSQ